MAYIGRGTDKLSNIEKLDTITFDGSSSYTLQKNSVNFTPNSANSLQVSIDGVVQAGNFTVSGSTIDFGVAIPSTSTNDFIFHYGTGLITTPADGTVSLDKLSATGTKDATTFLRGDNTFDTPSIASLSTASGSAPSYSARAWVNFNGTGTVAIRASGNVTSITDNGTGDYTVNFTTAMPDVNYSAVASGEVVLVTRTVILAPVSVGYTTSSIRIIGVNNATDVLTDTANCNVSIFR